MEYIIRTLIDDGYNEEKYKRAKEWILWGDWSSKYDPTISLPDFNPTDSMMEKCKRTADNLRTAPQGLPAEVVALHKKDTITSSELQNARAIWQQRCQSAIEPVSTLSPSKVSPDE